ncbi:MAG: inositol monophosphatase family protein [Flavobacteriales bacterium]|jgi:myo-inositol-1(or 4)-monophosphatase|nr:inositol monophosphatase family protein [Flavobacteriales bacterium]|tara:strand:- start:405 stop:1160 length:756 start_codon:yes stop_codon:yes gene_type:complete
MKSLMFKAAKAAGKVILEHYGNIGKLKFKAPRDIVTKADVLSEKIIIETIRSKFPDHGFITEESGSLVRSSEYKWIIDPIDGTINYASKIPEFAVSIALAKNDEILMGVVYNPVTNDMYFAEKGKGAYLNNKKIEVSKKNELRHCLLGFSTPSGIKLGRKSWNILRKSHGSFRAVRNSGSAALNLCYVADRKFDMYFSLNLNAWDVAAAKIIVEEAGGKVTNINNKKWSINDKTVVGSNKILHNKLIKLLK